MEQYLYKRHIKGIQHIGIPTDKYSETLDFYKSLGFEDINQEEVQGKKTATQAKQLTLMTEFQNSRLK